MGRDRKLYFLSVLCDIGLVFVRRDQYDNSSAEDGDPDPFCYFYDRERKGQGLPGDRAVILADRT